MINNALASTPQELASPPMQIRWVKLEKYCELSGDTKQAVYFRRKTRVWKEGVHLRKDPQNRLWVNLEEVENWLLQNTNTNCQKGSQYAHL